MAKIFGQKIALTTLNNAMKNDSLHHSLLFYGPNSCGKSETALNLAKTFFCKEVGHGFCDKCLSCNSISLYRNPSIIILGSDDRIPFLKFLTVTLLENRSKNKGVIAKAFASEMASLLYRHKMNFLNILKNAKVSYSEGEVLKISDIEETLSMGYNIFNAFMNNGGELSHTKDEIIECFTKIQNCLDRTVLTKESLERLWMMLHTRAENKRIVVIHNIEKIHASVVGTFLKILEEPPENHFIILTTDSIENINPEVITPLQSRCFEVKFSPLTTVETEKIITQKYYMEEKWYTPGDTIQNFIEKSILLSGNHNIHLQEILLEIFTNKGYNFGHVISMLDKKEISVDDVIRAMHTILIQMSESPNSKGTDALRWMKIGREMTQMQRLVHNYNFSRKYALVKLLSFVKRTI